MVYVKATQTDYEEAGIPISTERVVDGKYIKHVEHLTAEQMNVIRLDAVKFEFIDAIPIEGDING
jgi:hypothetical protein